MNRSFIHFESSGGWVVLILIFSALLSYFLYVKKDVPWSKSQNWLLFSIRTVAITLLLVLLLDPSIKRVKNKIEKPIIALAIDNSESITARGADAASILERINALKDGLEASDLEVKLFNLDSVVDSIRFDYRTSRLSEMLTKTADDLSNKNFVSTILLSDGIYNRGLSPLYSNYLTPVFTVGMGDSIPPKDISISRTLYNRVTFKGNKTPIRLEIKQNGYKNRRFKVSLTEEGKEIDSKTVELSKDIAEVEFLLTSDKEGLRHLVAKIENDSEELISENNVTDIFLEVIDGRQKILIIASSPHPDIKAIRAALAETDNYSTELYIPAIDQQKPEELYDVIVYHGAFEQRINFIPKENPGIWHIIGNRSNISRFNQSLDYLQIAKRGNEPDKVSGSFNQSFSKFKIDDPSIFEEYPPIEVPFGNYNVAGSAEVMMFQKLGNVITKKPLMVVNDNGTQKSAVLVGQNIWKWRLQEAALNDNAAQFQNFITKTIQYLSVRNDKKQFRFNSRKSTFSNSSPVLLDAEVYNDIYERIYGNAIEIEITNESGESQQFDFIDSELNNTFKAPGLRPGVYTFRAQTRIGEELFTELGEFLIEDVNPELLDVTADHRMLVNLAQKTGGSFVHFNNINQLPLLIAERDFKPIIKSEEEFRQLISIWWWYLIIFGLFTTEWALRKYWGGY